MLKSIKISLKDTFVYGLGNVAVKLVGLLLIHVYTDPKYFLRSIRSIWDT